MQCVPSHTDRCMTIIEIIIKKQTKKGLKKRREVHKQKTKVAKIGGREEKWGRAFLLKA